MVYIDDPNYLFNTIDYVRRHNFEAELPADLYSWIESLRSDDI